MLRIDQDRLMSLPQRTLDLLLKTLPVLHELQYLRQSKFISIIRSMDTDVVIVGGGPSGLVLGLFLAEYRVKVSLYFYVEERTTE